MPTILYIEDNLYNVQLVERLLLQRADIQLLTSVQGSPGISIAQGRHPDLILLDVHLPDINGFDVLERLRADASTANIPIVILSADATPGQVRKFRDAGANEYLTKPLDLKLLLTLIDNYLGVCRSRQRRVGVCDCARSRDRQSFQRRLGPDGRKGRTMAETFQFILSERRRDTVTIWLNLPNRLNVLTRALMEELTQAFNDAGESDATGVILAAKGRLFSAGHDFAEMANQDLESVRGLFGVCTNLMQTIQSIPQPVVARVHGLATGGGCQLVATCDLAVAAEEATFCTPGGKGGLFCTTPMVAVGRSIGRKRALEMAMTGDAIDARTAESWGLINLVVPINELDDASTRLLRRATRGSSVSKGIGKRAFYEQMSMDQSDAYAYASDVMAAASLLPDAQESIAAFIEKRQPKFGSTTVT